MDGHVHLGPPTLVRARAQPVTDHALDPADGGLGSGPGGVSGRFLPRYAPVLGDELKMAVALRGGGLGRVAGYGGDARRPDKGRLRRPRGGPGADPLLVVRHGETEYDVTRTGSHSPSPRGKPQT